MTEQRWYAESKRFDSTPSPCIVHGEKPGSKTPGGAPSPYYRVEAITEDIAHMGLRELFDHFNPKPEPEVHLPAIACKHEAEEGAFCSQCGAKL